MTTVTPTVGRPSSNMIIVAALLVAVFAGAIIDAVVPVTMVDIATTFGILPGTVARLGSFNAVAIVITALLLGAFGARFRYKLLVVIGVLFIAFCALGLFLAPNFLVAQIIFPLNGAGSVIIGVTAQTFIGNSYPLDKKAKAIGWVVAAGTFAGLVGFPIVGFMTGIGGWRSVLIWFMLPVAVVSLIFVFLVFPYNAPGQQPNVSKEPFMSGFRQVLTNKSATACLASGFLGQASAFAAGAFGVTFLRQVFSLSPGFAALVGMVASALITVGAIIGGQLVNRVGRKRQTVVAGFLSGIFFLLSYFTPDLWICLALRLTGATLGGVTFAAAANLILEQVPKFRGTAMSLSSAFGGIGVAVGLAVGGAVLDLYVNPTIGFQALGLAMGALGFAAVLVNLFLVKEPVKTQLQR